MSMSGLPAAWHERLFRTERGCSEQRVGGASREQRGKAADERDASAGRAGGEPRRPFPKARSHGARPHDDWVVDQHVGGVLLQHATRSTQLEHQHAPRSTQLEHRAGGRAGGARRWRTCEAPRGPPRRSSRPSRPTRLSSAQSHTPVSDTIRWFMDMARMVQVDSLPSVAWSKSQWL
jgi:hypothetical protein